MEDAYRKLISDTTQLGQPRGFYDDAYKVDYDEWVKGYHDDLWRRDFRGMWPSKPRRAKPHMAPTVNAGGTYKTYQGKDFTVSSSFYDTTATSSTADSIMYFTVSTDNATSVTVPVMTSIAPTQPRVAAPPRGFNRYVNASDLLEEFILFLGEQGVQKREFMDLPISLFVKWLIIRAMEEDGEEPDVVLQLPAPTGQPRCYGCGRFMQRTVKLPMHDSRCAAFYYERVEVLAA